MKFSPLLSELIDALKVLPGVGPKSAQRMAFVLLERERTKGKRLGKALLEAMDNIGHCRSCRTFTEDEVCHICANTMRKECASVCVVESPPDVIAIEQTGQFNGTYFVLMGHLSPLDGIGPRELGLDVLKNALEQNKVQEVILATNPTIEGDATAHYIAQMCKQLNIKASRIAHGVPVGGELEFVDGTTLSHAFSGRKLI